MDSVCGIIFIKVIRVVLDVKMRCVLGTSLDIGE